MITEFDFENCRESSILYKTAYKQVARKYQRGKYEEAAELAVAYFQVMLQGYTTTDDEDIEDLVEPYAAMSKKSNERYSRKVERDKNRQIEELQLHEIAQMLRDGKSYGTIADTLGVVKGTITYRVGIMRDKYPELLENVVDPNTGDTVQIVQTIQNNDNDNDNDNDNVNDNDNDKEKEKENVVGFGQAERQPASVNASDKSSDEYILSLIKKYKPFKNSSGMIVFQEVPMFSEMEAINHYLSNHPEAVNAA